MDDLKKAELILENAVAEFITINSEIAFISAISSLIDYWCKFKEKDAHEIKEMIYAARFIGDMVDEMEEEDLWS